MKHTTDDSMGPAIKNLRGAMDRLWHAVTDVTTAADQLNDPAMWDGKSAGDFRTKWATLKPQLGQTIKNADPLNQNLVKYNTEIDGEIQLDHL
jgi:uncharacterized protein YukE